MKNQWMKTTSIVLAALLLLAVLPMSAMAEKESKTGTGAKATASNASKEVATSSDAYEDGELLDGAVKDDLPPVEEEKAVPETKPEAVPEEVQEKEAEVSIAGTWTVDGITTYRFDENGTGELILPEHEFAFDYTVEEDELTLEFDDSSINTAVFTFAVEDDTLVLKREEKAGTSEFTLEKTAD